MKKINNIKEKDNYYDFTILKVEEHNIIAKCIHCGEIKEYPLCTFKYGNIKYCQTCNPKNITYGYIKKREKLYNIWREMNRRCYSEKCCNYHKYGAKGIKVCDEWLRDCDGGKNGYNNFRQWALNNGYKEGLTLDRINPYKDYCPNNCRWVTYNIQNTHLIISKFNKSGYKGISQSKSGKWLARLKINDKQIEIGAYKTKKEAVEARNKYIIDNNLSHDIQKWIGDEGYNKETFIDTL